MNTQKAPVVIGGKEIAAFVCTEVNGELQSIAPVPVDGQNSHLFTQASLTGKTEVSIFGLDSDIGTRIAERYADGELPKSEVSWDTICDE